MAKKTKRKGLSQTIRFEVFKRDAFKCQYCGKSAPEVTLEVDHIIPVSKGGWTVEELWETAKASNTLYDIERQTGVYC
jgi:5-methylcytosine-specific restriction endonuclease McrA